jgi:hypothetical protein
MNGCISKEHAFAKTPSEAGNGHGVIKKTDVGAITAHREFMCINAVSAWAEKCDQGGSRGGRRRCSVAMECKRRALHSGGANRYPKLGAVVGSLVIDADTSVTFLSGQGEAAGSHSEANASRYCCDVTNSLEGIK